MDTKINNINFQAKMNVSKCKTYKPYWEKVAKSFETQTKKIPGEIELAEKYYTDDLRFRFVSALERRGEGSIVCNKETSIQMTNDTPANAAKKLAQAFEIAAKAATDVSKLRNQLYKKANEPEFSDLAKSNWNKFTKLHFYDLTDKINAKINNDLPSSLKGFEIFV